MGSHIYAQVPGSAPFVFNLRVKIAVWAANLTINTTVKGQPKNEIWCYFNVKTTVWAARTP